MNWRRSREGRDLPSASRVLPLQQYLRAIDIIKKRHFSSRARWSFIVLATPARCLTDGAELRPA